MMRVKKFRAATMPEVLATIRSDLGPDAVILHSEQIAGGWLSRLLGRPTLEVTAAVDTDLRDFPQPTAAANDAMQRLERELGSIKATLAQITEARRAQWPQRFTALDEWYLVLLERGVESDLAHQIVKSVAGELSRWALADVQAVNQHVQRHLTRRLPPSKPLTLTPGRPPILFLVGPTGVGKTTTIAKLAASFVRTRGTRVLVVTVDTFRIGAIAQMTTFCEILGIPASVAYSPERLAALVDANRDCDLILVDTPGRSHRDSAGLAEVGAFLSAVPEKVVYLALTAGAKYEDMLEAVEAFSTSWLDGLLFTKLDETSSLGPAYTLACTTGLPLSYFSTGQSVPDDLEVATATRLVELLVRSAPRRLPRVASQLPAASRREEIYDPQA